MAAKLGRTTLSWGQEDADLLSGLRGYNARALGKRLKQLALAGLMLERMGITVDDKGVVQGLYVTFMANHGKAGVIEGPTPAAPSPAPGLFGMTEEQDAGYAALMDGLGL